MSRSTLARLAGLLAPHWRWVLAGVFVGALAIGANVALVATSAYLVSKAALVTNVAELALAITAVRVLAIGRAAFRYVERYVTHVATLRILADLRVWFYASIEPLAPARLTTLRSGDLLARIGADVETLEDFYVRVVVPPASAAIATAFACLLLGAFDALLGIVLLRLPGADRHRPAAGDPVAVAGRGRAIGRGPRRAQRRRRGRSPRHGRPGGPRSA